MFKRILLTTDGSPVIERAVLYAEHLARVEGAEIIVLHAYEPPERYAAFAGYDQLLERYEAIARALVDEVVAELHEDGVAARAETRAGPPADMIMVVAREYNVDLIIVGMRGGGNLQAMLGSVGAQVLRSAHCPVLQIP